MNRGLLSTLLALGVSTVVIAEENITPYLGVDAKWNRMGVNSTTNGNVVQKNYPQGNFFGGFQFNEWSAVELGYETTTNRSRSATTIVGGNFFGDINEILPVQSNTKTRISGFHVDLVGLYPVSQEQCFNLIGSIGIAQLQIKSSLNFSYPPSTQVISLQFSKRKIVPRVTLGIQKLLNETFGVRAMLGWEGTAGFRNIYAVNSTLFMKPKDSFSIGVGFLYKFK